MWPTNNLLFAESQFQDIFPTDPEPDPGNAPKRARETFLEQFTDIFDDDPIGSYATVALTQGETTQSIQVNARGMEAIGSLLGPGDDVFQLVAGDYEYDFLIDGGGGNDTFNVDNGVNTHDHRVTFDGGAGDDLVFIDFSMASLIDPGSLAQTPGTRRTGYLVDRCGITE